MVIADKIAPIITGVISGIDGYFGKNIIIAIVSIVMYLFPEEIKIHKNNPWILWIGKNKRYLSISYNK